MMRQLSFAVMHADYLLMVARDMIAVGLLLQACELLEAVERLPLGPRQEEALRMAARRVVEVAAPDHPAPPPCRLLRFSTRSRIPRARR